MHSKALVKGRPPTKSDYVRLSEFRHRLRKFLRASELACRANGLTPLQYQLLLHVAGIPGRSWATVGELADRLQSHHHGVVALLDRCVGLELLERRGSADDGRVVEVHLLPKGQALLAQVARLHRDELHRLLGEVGSPRAASGA